MSKDKLALTLTGLALAIHTLPAAASIVANVQTTSSTTAVLAEELTDFIVYDSNGSGTTVTKSGGPGMFSSLTSDGSILPGGYGSAPVTLQWSDGTPTASGSSYYCQYATFGSGFAPQASWLEMTLTMPSTEGTLTLWTYPNGNSGSLSYDVTFGKTGDQYTETDTLEDIGKIYEFELSEFNVNDTLTFRIDNVSGSNSWHSVGIYGAQFEAIPEPASVLMLIPGLSAMLIRLHRRRLFLLRKLKTPKTDPDHLRPNTSGLSALINRLSSGIRRPALTLPSVQVNWDQLFITAEKLDRGMNQTARRISDACNQAADRFWDLFL